MKYLSYEILVEKEREGEGYFAYSPTLPGCYSNGATIKKAERNMQKAIEQHVGSLAARGQASL